jgi:hypothetical protein
MSTYMTSHLSNTQQTYPNTLQKSSNARRSHRAALSAMIACSLLSVALVGCTPKIQSSTPAEIAACQSLQGVWKGTYEDASGLFPKQPFPMVLYLEVHDQSIQGYTLSADDASGASWGIHAPYWIFGQCRQGDIISLYLVKPSTHICGAPVKQQPIQRTKNTLQLILPYENAMTDTQFFAKLSRIDHPSLAIRAELSRHEKVIHEVESVSKTSVPSCH